MRGPLRIEILPSGLVIALVCMAGAAAAQPLEEEPAEPEAPREHKAKGPIAVRAEEHVIVAEEAVVIGDEAAAGRAIDLAWLYLESPLFQAWWRASAASGDRLYGEVLANGVAEVEAKRQAIVAVRRAVQQRDAAKAALAQAHAARAPASEEYTAAARLAEECERTSMPAAEWILYTSTFVVVPEGLSARDVSSQCVHLTAQIEAEAVKVDEAWRVRDSGLRAVLKGERLGVYEQLGEPGGALAGAAAAVVAKAKVWEFVIGPTGKLKTYETWVITFSGNKVVSRKRSRSHEAPP